MNNGIVISAEQDAENNGIIELYLYLQDKTQESLLMEICNMPSGQTNVNDLCQKALELYETAASITDKEKREQEQARFWNIATLAMNLDPDYTLNKLGSIFDQWTPTGP